MCPLQGGSVSSPVKTTFLERNVATFDAKFSGVTPHPETTPAPAGGRGIGVNPPPSTSSSQSSTNEQTFAFLGAWEDLWESHLHERKILSCTVISWYSVPMCPGNQDAVIVLNNEVHD